MALFEHPDYHNHENVSYYHDAKTGLRAIIAVHNTTLGPSLGGCRMFPYANSDEALTDVLRLSSGMSYKAAMAGLPQGGGKAVIIGNPREHKSAALMQAMGRFVNSFNGSYIIAEDSGISVSDVLQMQEATTFTGGCKASYSFDGTTPDGNPAPATAYGVFCGIKAAVDYVYGTDLLGKKVAIQGVGHVGLRLAKHLHQAGAELFVSDIYDDNLLIAEAEFGATIVDNNSIHSLPVDVYAPCALGGAINKDTIDDIRARVVAGAANNQLATDDMGTRLLQNNIAYVPDYVINAGGIIDIYHQTQSDSSNALLKQQLENIGNTVMHLLTEAEAQNKATVTIANAMAEEVMNK
ncbi:MAG: Glu/Leu/Phe/Val dehydrogenase dimerization domain-containing protein [Glaciecola sp.]